MVRRVRIARDGAWCDSGYLSSVRAAGEPTPAFSRSSATHARQRRNGAIRVRRGEAQCRSLPRSPLAPLLGFAAGDASITRDSRGRKEVQARTRFFNSYGRNGRDRRDHDQHRDRLAHGAGRTGERAADMQARCVAPSLGETGPPCTSVPVIADGRTEPTFGPPSACMTERVMRRAPCLHAPGTHFLPRRRTLFSLERVRSTRPRRGVSSLA